VRARQRDKSISSMVAAAGLVPSLASISPSTLHSIVGCEALEAFGTRHGAGDAKTLASERGTVPGLADVYTEQTVAPQVCRCE
jgi:hypothetical protein